jgi:geranylgeranyl diphosphate synthase type II
MRSSTSSDGPGRLAALVSDYLGELASSAPADAFDEALRYPLLAGGKRLRPLLCLATVEALGGDVRAALPAAAALELVHTFSLVHDDLPALDDDALRRGRPTTHVAFGEDVAILVGDALLNGAYRLVLRRLRCPASRRAAVLTALAEGVDGLIRGQYLDLRIASEPDEAALRRMCALKTGALIEASVAVAVALVAAAPGIARPYEELAAELGVGFQLVDDVLDATGSDETLGKPAGSDARRGKRTFVTVLGLDRARALAAESEARATSLAAALPGRPEAIGALVAGVYARDR